MAQKSSKARKASKGAAKGKGIGLDDIQEGQELPQIFPLDPDKGISTIRVSKSFDPNDARYLAVKFKVAVEGTIMCGW